MIIEERKYNRKIHILCEKLMKNSGWEVHKPEPQPKLPTKQGGTVFLVRDELKKEYVGFCRVINSPWIEVWIMEICINPEYRKSGIGKALVKGVIKSANGKIVLAWGVGEGQKFFQKLGFKQSSAPVYYFP